jgi:hypothetical protein
MNSVQTERLRITGGLPRRCPRFVGITIFVAYTT